MTLGSFEIRIGLSLPFPPSGLYPYLGLDTGGRSQKLSPLPWGEGGERSEPSEGLLGYVGPSDPPRRASDPSPGPRRLVKAPVAVHPLPLGEGKDPIPSLSPRERGRRQKWGRCVQREMWDTLSSPLGERGAGIRGLSGPALRDGTVTP